MAKYLTLEELEKRFQVRSIKEKGYQALSRGLNFEICKEQNQISLHIPITFFENAKSALELFTEGLRILAHKMMTEQELRNIKEITGHSLLVKEKHLLLTSLGFSVILDKDGKPTEDTKISREKFLEIYGKPKQND